MITELREQLKGIEVCEPVVAEGLQVFGVRWPSTDGVAYVTLDEALAAGSLGVTEVNEAGSVPNLLVDNRGDTFVFIMAGEQLVGAKQNRVLNASIMAPKRQHFVVPVSCVEAGRWGYRARGFRSAGSGSHGKLRAAMSRHACASYKKTGRPGSDQGEVWRHVDVLLHKMRSYSPSSALQQVYEDHREKLDRAIAQATVPADCHGVVFAFAGQVVGMDLFDKPATLAKLLPKLVRAYAIDAVQATEAQPVDRVTVQSWLAKAQTATYERYDSPGVGQDIRIQGDQLVGASLIVDGNPVHVELFAEDEPPVARRPARPHPAEPRPASSPPPPGAPQPHVSDLAVLPTSPELLRLTALTVPALRPVLGVSLRVSLALVDTRPAGVLSHADEVRLTQLARACPAAARLRLVLTDAGLADNWFSHWHAEAQTAIVSLHQWAQIATVPAVAFVAYALSLLSLRLNPAVEIERLLHEETRGCPFDFCGDKQDIEFKLREGRLCTTCQRALRSAGVDLGVVEGMIEVVRHLAHSRS